MNPAAAAAAFALGAVFGGFVRPGKAAVGFALGCALIIQYPLQAKS